MKYKLLFVLVIACLTLSEGCKNKEADNPRENYIKNIIGKELILNDNLMVKGEDSCLYANELYKSLKIVVYSDSLSCACELKLPLWKIRFKELLRNNNNVGLVFIINTNDIPSVELDIQVTKVQGIKLYDCNGVFEKNNDLYNDSDLHVFLIDRDNKVLLVGNPLDNHKLFALYKNLIDRLKK
ncbi:hypothetical protein AGMMS50239_12570 [Bacteroidia bacterium]|nr:hypothetical protein AGMMS50239_12570 [Bacteroidia bacterium]